MGATPSVTSRHLRHLAGLGLVQRAGRTGGSGGGAGLPVRNAELPLRRLMDMAPGRRPGCTPPDVRAAGGSRGRGSGG
ncbi:hypothetical protein ACUXZZ_09930 [Streptomyces graminifolii]|uniref:hypothetical protein n=1 Tax=Streptomyces graminifolii TaxID=1266771 RepID=UPI0040584A69